MQWSIKWQWSIMTINNKHSIEPSKTKTNYNRLKIIDFNLLRKFNIYQQYFCTFQNFATFNEMKKRSKNELEKQIN